MIHRSATISVLVENESGVLARVIGLFSGRGYNIDSLTVAPVDDARGISRINVVTSGTEMVIEQIKAQLDRLVPVHRVSDLALEGPFLSRELALMKVVTGTGEHRAENPPPRRGFPRARGGRDHGKLRAGADRGHRQARRVHRPAAAAGAGRGVAHGGGRDRARGAGDLSYDVLYPFHLEYHNLKRTGAGDAAGTGAAQ